MNSGILAEFKNVKSNCDAYARSLAEFCNTVSEEITGMKNNLKGLSNYWNGEFYEVFAEVFNKKICNIEQIVYKSSQLREAISRTGVRLQAEIEKIEREISQ